MSGLHLTTSHWQTVVRALMGIAESVGEQSVCLLIDVRLCVYGNDLMLPVRISPEIIDELIKPLNRDKVRRLFAYSENTEGHRRSRS